MEVVQNIKKHKKDLEGILTDIKTSITDAHQNKINFKELQDLQNEQIKLLKKFPKRFTLKNRKNIPKKDYNPIPQSNDWLNYFDENILNYTNSSDKHNNNESSVINSDTSSIINNSNDKLDNKENNKPIDNGNLNNSSVVESTSSSGINNSQDGALNPKEPEPKNNTSQVESADSSGVEPSLTDNELAYFGIPPGMGNDKQKTPHSLI